MARFYAELPDNDFNSLADNANDHSLFSLQQESPVTVEMRSTCITTTASAAADLSQNIGNGDGIKLSTCRLALKTTHSAQPSQYVVRLENAMSCHHTSRMLKKWRQWVCLTMYRLNRSQRCRPCRLKPFL